MDFYKTEIGLLLLKHDNALGAAWKKDTEESFNESSFSHDRAVAGAWEKSDVVRAALIAAIQALMARNESLETAHRAMRELILGNRDDQGAV